MSARVFFLVAIITLALAKSFPENPKLISQFEDFIKQYDKKYTDEMEKAMRFRIFVQNLDWIDHLNKRSKKAKFGITKFADKTNEEFMKAYTGLKPLGNDGNCTTVTDVGNSTTDKEFDWRKKGAVSRVRNQGGCGSCWAFSAIGNLEGVYAIKYGKLVEFSEQQLIDCDIESNGCKGGLTTNALAYLKSQGAITEIVYPYNEDDGVCYYDKSKVFITPKDCHIYNVSEDAYAEKVQQIGPLSIAIDAQSLMVYYDGILSGDDCEGSTLNHGVLLVGFGEENGTKYWIVKNSWGQDWGEDGYFRMERGVNCLAVTNAPPVSAVL